MKSPTGPLVRRLALLLGTLSATTLGLADAPRYSYTVLDTPGTGALGFSINNAGQIVGQASTGDSTFAYLYSSADGTYEWIGSTSSGGGSAAYGINETDQIAGAAWLSPLSSSWPAIKETGFIHGPNGSEERIDPLGGGERAKTFAINSSGHAVGWADSTTPVGAGQLGSPRAIIHANGTTENLGVLAGDSVSVAYAINDVGQIVGYSGTGVGAGQRAFIYQGGTMQELGTLVTDPNATSVAQDINNLGQIVGSASVAGGQTHAFLHADGQMHDLGTLSDQGDSHAHAINEQGWIVGISDKYQSQTYTTVTRAFLYVDGQMHELNSLIDGFGISDNVLFASEGDALNSHGHVGKSINDWGQIVVGKVIDGQNRVLLLNPTAPIQTTLLGGAGRNAKLVAGETYAKFTPLVSPESFSTRVTLLDGIAGANRDITLAFLAAPAAGFASDVVEVTGTGTDIFVLQLTYDAAVATDLFGDESLARLAWFDPSDQQWKDAVLGNSSSIASFVTGAYDADAHFILGTHGIDTDANTVWAVLDHNSSFAVTSAIPEPAATGVLLGGTGLLIGLVRRRRRSSDNR